MAAKPLRCTLLSDLNIIYISFEYADIECGNLEPQKRPNVRPSSELPS